MSAGANGLAIDMSGHLMYQCASVAQIWNVLAHGCFVLALQCRRGFYGRGRGCSPQVRLFQSVVWEWAQRTSHNQNTRRPSRQQAIRNHEISSQALEASKHLNSPAVGGRTAHAFLGPPEISRSNQPFPFALLPARCPMQCKNGKIYKDGKCKPKVRQGLELALV
jgi:hypothetical protein